MSEKQNKILALEHLDGLADVLNTIEYHIDIFHKQLNNIDNYRGLHSKWTQNVTDWVQGYATKILKVKSGTPTHALFCKHFYDAIAAKTNGNNEHYDKAFEAILKILYERP